MSLHHRAGTTADGADPLVVTPELAGWTYCGLRVAAIAAGQGRELRTEGVEMAVLPLSGAVTVEVDGRRFDLAGRRSVFDRVTDWAYVPLDAEVRIASEAGAEVAMATARAERRFDPHHGAAADVAVELRGAGQSSRQINNFMSPEQFDGADRLMCVEVYTPDGNWSSYPPHRHDDSPECPVANEEIYYFRIGAAGTTDYSAEGFGLHRCYTGPNHTGDLAIDETVEVRDGDVFVIPRGYHGPCVAAPGYTMYYLNVLAGPGGERSMAFCDDPTHHWVRDTWSDQDVDPRLPLLSANGPRLGGGS